MKPLVIMSSLCMLVACGGGGSSSSSPSSSPSSIDNQSTSGHLTVSGTAATGKAISGAAINAKCQIGTGSSATIGDGTYSLIVTGGKLPCILQVTDPADGSRLHTIVAGNSDAATANVTPLTEMLTARVLGNEPVVFFSAFDPAVATSMLTMTNVRAAQTDVSSALKDAIDTSALGDFITTPLKAATPDNATGGDTQDRMLDVLRAKLKGYQLTQVVAALAHNPSLTGVKQVVGALIAAPTITTKDQSLIQVLIENINGGYRSTSNFITDGITNFTNSNTCGVETFPERSTLEKAFLDLGGTVTNSTASEWCGKSNAESTCIKKVDKSFFLDSRASQGSNIKIYMTGLLAEHITTISFDSTKSLAEVETRSKDPSVANSDACNNSGQSNQAISAINGTWNGYMASYSQSTKSGSTAAAAASCADQTCTLSGATNVTVKLSEFSNGISWRTSAGALKLAGATISSDRQLLSMYVCNPPLNNAKTLDDCSFFTFKAAAPASATTAVADSGKYTCTTISNTVALALFSQGHTYLDRDHDGKPCEASDILLETPAIIPTTITPISDSGQYTCSTISHTLALSLFSQGHTYLDRDHDGMPCESTDILIEKPATIPTSTPSSGGKCYVKGYYRKSGTYVNGYYRSC